MIIRRTIVRVIGLCVLLTPFSGCLRGGDSSDGSTSWVLCDQNVGCSGTLRCLCGVCTTPCVSSADCKALGGAVCAISGSSGSVCDGTPRVESACLTPCSLSGTCRGGFTCHDGFCIAAHEGGSSADAGDAALDASVRDGSAMGRDTGACALGAACGATYGCCAGQFCYTQPSYYSCMRAMRNVTFCQQYATGVCYPEGSTPCDPKAPFLGTCPYMDASANATCCAPISGTKLFACADPSSDPVACAPCESPDADAADPFPVPSCDGGTCPVTLASGLNVPHSVAVDATNAYYTTSSDDVVAVPLSGGTPTTLASGQTLPYGITVHGGYLYWTTNSLLQRMPVTGGTPTLLSLELVSRFAVDDTHVYFASPNGSGNGPLMRVPVTGGTAETLATSPGAAMGVAIDAAHVYWVSSDLAGAAWLSRASLDGSSPTTLAAMPISSGAFAIDGTYAYVANSVDDRCGRTSTLTKVPLVGGAATPFASWKGDFSDVVADGTNVYWSTGIRILKSGPQGGSYTIMPVEQTLIDAIAVDATSLYWSSATDGVVMRLTPK